MSEPEYDVIISGAGPVGLFLACELALAKCKVLVLEKAADPNSVLKRAPFGIRGLNTPSIESLDRRGFLFELELHKKVKSPHQNAGTGARRQVGHFAGIPFHEGDIDPSQFPYRLPTSTPTHLISEMAELETVFLKRAEALGVVIQRGSEVASFEQNTSGVTVKSNTHTVTAKYLVGCDGARSAVRKAAGFEFAGTEPEFTGYTTQIEIADPEKLFSGRIVTATGMYMQSQPGYVIIQEFDHGAFHASEKPLTKEHIQAVLRRVSNTDVSVNEVHAATTWTDRARQATSYRKGRVLIAGDAAHIHAPLGGQGLNLGLGDAMNLGWKLASVIHGTLPDELLGSYEKERQPLGQRVLDWSRAQVGIMKPTPEAKALYAITREMINTQQGATYFAGRVWGVDTHYDLQGDHLLVGRSCPNFEFLNGVTVNHLLRSGEALRLDFKSNPPKYVLKEFPDLKGLHVRPDGIVAAVFQDD